MLAAAIIGCVVGSIVLLACWCMLSWVSRQTRSELQRQIDTLSAAVQVFERDHTGHPPVTTMPNPAVAKIEIVAPVIFPGKAISSVPALPSAAHDPSEIPPEAQAAIKATLSAFLGHKVQIRSVRLVENPDAPTTWATQGRVAIQTSHNQRTSRT